MALGKRSISGKGGLVLACGVLALALLVFEFTEIDFWLQDFFYSFDRHAWIVPKRAPVPRMIFYHGPKMLLIGYGVWLLLSLHIPRSWKIRRWLSTRSSRELIYLMVCLGLFPAVVGALKKASGIHCPSEITRYGGEHPYRKLFSPRPRDPRERGHCFPAGHASGGFALLGLYFVGRTQRARRSALGLALIAGWSMGLYQMLNGAHFLSHTVVTMLLAWIFTLSIALVLRLPATRIGPASTQT
jgi:membrane-associated PAP2 superfamily phosphatase